MNLEKIKLSAGNVAKWFSENFDENSGLKMDDIAVYFKIPSMFLAANDQAKATEVQKFVMKKFLVNSGDFRLSKECKTEHEVYEEYYSYMNCWIIRSGLKLGLDMTNSLDYIHKNHSEFELKETPKTENSIELLTIANIGYTYLIAENFNESKRAADSLEYFWNSQQELDKYFYLRMNKNLNLIKTNPENPLTCITRANENQLYFFLGFPIAFLAELYDVTKLEKYLTLSKKYFDYTINCNGVLESNTSHKVAWASSILYRVTGDDIYLDTVEKITNHIIHSQCTKGLWLTNNGTPDLDQSAEMGCWFYEIIKNIEKRKK